MNQNNRVGIADDAAVDYGHTAASVDDNVAADRPSRTRDLRDFWRRTLALLVPLPVLALTVGLVAAPFPIGGAFGAAIAGAAAHPSRAQATLWLLVISGLLMGPATMACAWTCRRRAPWLTLAAGVSLIVAYGAGLPDSVPAAVSAATQGLDLGQVTALDDAVAATPAADVATTIFLVGQTLGFGLLGIALWRGRVVPAWLGLVLAASGPAHLLMPGGNAGTAASWAMTAIGYAGAGVALWRSPGTDFDLAPTGRGSALARVPSAGEQLPPPRPDARTPWRWLLAIAAVPVPVFVAVFRYLMPYDGSDTPPEIFAALVGAANYQDVVIWLGIPVSMCGFAGALAVAWLTRRTTPVLTTIAIALAVPGYAALFAGGTYGDLLSQVTRTVPGLDYQTAFHLGYGIESSPQTGAVGLIFVVGHLFGTTLLGLALWRSRTAPTWLAIGLLVSQPIHLTSVMTDVRWLDLLGWGLTALGFAWAAWRLAKLPNDEFDLPPTTEFEHLSRAADSRDVRA